MHSLPSSKLAWTLLAIVGHSHASSFSPECTVPPPGTSYVSSPNIRGTTSILLNCLSIILLCTWNIQHLNIPASRAEPKSSIQGVWWAILDSRTKIKWMIFTILVPEYLIGKAFGERLAAKAGVKLVKKSQLLDPNSSAEQPTEASDVVEPLQWEDIHAYMANMGYFVVDFSGVLDVNCSMRQPKIVCTLEDCMLMEESASFQSLVDQSRDRISNEPSPKITLQLLQHRAWALNNSQLVSAAFALDLIDLPDVSRRDLARLDRGDKLVKTLALLQIGYLVIQLVARRALNLFSTQLEVATLAFSASSMITYGLYWSRPQGVEGVYVINAKKLPDIGTVKTMVDFVQCLNKWSWWIVEALDYNEEAIPLAFGAVVGGMLFGGLHCLAWNFHFPTSEEALAWKICSLLTTGLPVISIVPFATWQRFHSKVTHPSTGDRMISFLAGLALLTLLVAYILARLFLMVEIFRSLFFLPPEAFIDTWPGSFPHFTR
ncbi:hypothetical protein N431DRAFT_503621 [Stipitochalara longipes BDJ]|nr:hypothetical protein N431DRAFT_503621 [Stipitochalara longipes BDJ]